MSETAHPAEPASRLVVITGAGHEGQVAESVARNLAHGGFSLALISRGPDLAETQAATLSRLNTNQHFSGHAADLADPAAAASAASEILEVHKGIKLHGVVCIAGGFGMTGALDEADPRAWQHQLSINLDTAFATTRAFLPAVREAQGSFVYFSSAVALPGASTRGMAAYASAKSALLALMRSVAQEEKAHGTRANAIAPSGIRTASNLASMGDRDNLVDRESVADVVAFLLSRAARNVTGQVIALS